MGDARKGPKTSLLRTRARSLQKVRTTVNDLTCVLLAIFIMIQYNAWRYMKYHRVPTSKYAQPVRTSRARTYLTVVITAVIFVLALGLAFPQALAKVGLSTDSWSDPFRLGLDLQGGTHLVYEADMSEVESGGELDALAGVKDVIERRVNAFGVSEPVVQTTTTGGSYRVIIELAGVLDVNEAINLIGETPILEFKEASYELDRDPTEEEVAQLAEINAEEQVAAQAILNQALNGDEMTWETLGPASVDHAVYGSLVEAVDSWSWEARVIPNLVENDEGTNIVRFDSTTESEEMLLSHILICYEGKLGCESDRSALEATIQISNLKDQATPDNFAELADTNTEDPSGIGNGGDLDWVAPGVTFPSFELAAAALEVGEISDIVETDFGYHLIYKRDAQATTLYSLSRVLMPWTVMTDLVPPASPWKNTELSGRHLTRANVEFDQTSGMPYVSITFNSEGDKMFGELTERLIGEPLAIFLDGEAISVPTVQSAIYGGSAVITGSFTIEEAKLLAQRLNAGALPVPLNLMSQQTVGPTLGQISLEKSIMAALIGFAFVALYMIAYYRLAGLFAVGALIMYAVFNLALYKALDVTITLAGIAGFILSLGIAVDANVLIFERFREELKSGRDILGAIDEGFKRAWTSIRDGNITTLIAAAVLFWFSTSFIKGFALTLSLGILLSMFTAITVTRVWLRLISGWSWSQKLWLYGVKRKSE